ncbi:hypothetical protein CAEBREN_11531 [Caenorhabditis brenneri]|uniref:Uncharacterized protein n=1 Tax=Caenorhabditis brenneri TaxID=135651 RepID=G0MJR6_CAEBE|nr:hypothetical protein CAEBREN_11531 [Caenorhabditis brenneri]
MAVESFRRPGSPPKETPPEVPYIICAVIFISFVGCMLAWYLRIRSKRCLDKLRQQHRKASISMSSSDETPQQRKFCWDSKEYVNTFTEDGQIFHNEDHWKPCEKCSEILNNESQPPRYSTLFLNDPIL